jgi:actin-related protein
MDQYLPPECLFDAQLDIPATLAANMATFQGAPLLCDLLQQWMHYAGPRQEPPGWIPVIWFAKFVELTIRGRDLEGEGQAAIEAQAGAAASGGAGSSGHAAPRVTAAARGGEE